MLATPAGLTMVTFLSLRMRPEALRPVKWRLAEWPRRIFPPAVSLKRLLAPRWVFNFIFGFDAFLGIAKTFLLPLELSKNRRAIPRGPVPAKADPELPLLQHTFPEKLARPEQNKWRGETRGSLRLLRAGSSLSCGPGSSGALPGRQKRHENVAFHARHGLDLPLIANFQQQPVHLGTPHFLMGHLAATVKNHGAHFVAVTEEADNLILANLIVVFSSVGPKLYFFQLRAATALALLVGFLVLLVLIFPVVGDFADRRFGGGRNFHQIESPLTR